MQEYNVEIRRPNDESSANNDQAKSPEGAYSQRSNSPNQEERAGYLSPVVYDAPLPTSGTSDRLQSIQASPKIAETHAAEAKLKKYQSENVALLAKIAALAEELSQKTEEIEDREELNKDINRRFGEAAREIEEWAESIAQLAEGKRTDAMEMREKIAWDKIALRLGTKAKLLREKISKVLAKKKGFF